MNVGVHAILLLAFSFQLYGFDATIPYKYRKHTSAKDLDPTCSTTFLFRDATCLKVGPMFLDWPVNPLGRSDSSRPSLPPEVPSGEQQRGAFPASIRSPLETGCSSSTTADNTTFYRVGWMWPGGVGKAQSAKASLIVLRLSRLRHRHSVPLTSPATKSTS